MAKQGIVISGAVDSLRTEITSEWNRLQQVVLEAANRIGSCLLEAERQLGAKTPQYCGFIANLPFSQLSRHAPLLYLLGTAEMHAGKLSEGLAFLDASIELDPLNPQAHHNRGIVLIDLERIDEALQSYDRAIQLKPDFTAAYFKRGNVLRQLGRLNDALESYDRAIQLEPDFVDAHYNRGLMLTGIRQLDAALTSFDRAIQIEPTDAEAHNNRGNVLAGLKRPNEALESYDRAIQIRSNFADAYYNRGLVLKDLNRLAEALQSCDRAIQLNPDNEFWWGFWLHLKQNICDWDAFGSWEIKVAEDLDAGKKQIEPWVTLFITDSPRLQQRAARIWIESTLPAAKDYREPCSTDRERIRVGYFSADFHGHPTMHLIAEVLERHDRSRFEITGFSFGPDSNGIWRQRARKGFESFHDVRFKSDREVVDLARKLRLDIAVDLKGFTADSRTAIFSERCAPIQISYLGYPGTMGAPFIDYILADHTVIPDENRQYFTEKVAYLPNCYQANCREREVAGRPLSRAELCLPDSAFVFCCFSNNNKISPSVFESWMRILKQVHGSVLWLLESNRWASANLGVEARKMDVDHDRLIFAKSLPIAEHLNRLRHADLFLDTFPCSAHTTASDALRMGVPLLTRMGRAFAARVGASMLRTLGLDELITNLAEEYEQLAVELATDPVRLGAIKRNLVEQVGVSTLYDSELFARNLEQLYQTMHVRCMSGLKPTHIEVAGTG